MDRQIDLQMDTWSHGRKDKQADRLNGSEHTARQVDTHTQTHT